MSSDRPSDRLDHDARSSEPLRRLTSLILDRFAVAAWAVDTDQRVTLSVGRGLSGAGVSEHELEGSLLSQTCAPPDDVDIIEAAHRSALGGEAAQFRAWWRGRRWVAYVEPAPARGAGVVGVAWDVTHEEGALEELEGAYRTLQRIDTERRDLLARLVRAHEEERQRVASDVHDELGQRLTAIVLALGGLARRVPPHAAEELAAIERQVQALFATTRSIVRAMTPFDVRDLGLITALRRLGEETGARSGIAVDIALDENWLPPSVDVSITLYRIVQEALTNAVRHSGATNVQIALSTPPSGPRIVISDDGSGFVPERAERGIGVRSMRERVDSLGGRFAVEPGVPHGTRICVDLPSQP